MLPQTNISKDSMLVIYSQGQYDGVVSLFGPIYNVITIDDSISV